MGNGTGVLCGSMQAAARQSSQEPFASRGGLYEWTSKGALASDPIDQQVFSIPLNAMSEIIEDQDGYHIIRVLDRQDAGITPYEVQDSIRGIIRKEKIASQRQVLDQMQSHIPVWSLFRGHSWCRAFTLEYRQSVLRRTTRR